MNIQRSIYRSLCLVVTASIVAIAFSAYTPPTRTLSIEVLPNPVVDVMEVFVDLGYTNDNPSDVTLKLFNLRGQEEDQIVAQLGVRDSKLPYDWRGSINVSDLTPGIYWLTLEVKSQVIKVKKFLIRR